MSDEKNTQAVASTTPQVEDSWSQKIMKLAASYPEVDQKALITEAILCGTTLTTTDKGSWTARQLTAYEAFALVITAKKLGVDPQLKHIIPMEGGIYATLDGYLHVAHRSNRLISIKTRWEKSENCDYVAVTTVKRLSDDKSIEQEFDGEGIANKTNVKAADKRTDTFFKQMAEARSVRRALRLAFGIGLPFKEDVDEGLVTGTAAYEQIVDTSTLVDVASIEELTARIDAATNDEDFDALTEELSTNYSKYNKDQITEITAAIRNKRREVNEMYEEGEKTLSKVAEAAKKITKAAV